MTPQKPLELLGIDHLLTADERDIQRAVRTFVDERVRPNIADWYENGHLDLGLVREAGSLGLLGMHLDGYGCAGTNAVVLRAGLPGTRGGRFGCAQSGVGAGIARDVRHLAVRQRGAEAGVAPPDGRR